MGPQHEWSAEDLSATKPSSEALLQTAGMKRTSVTLRTDVRRTESGKTETFLKK